MIMPGPGEEPVLGTGGQIDAMVMAIIDAAYDKKPSVRMIMSSSLVDIGKKKPTLVLSSCHSYLRTHAKLQKDHRVVILQTMEKVVKESLEQIPMHHALDLIKLASEELTASKDVEPEWQTAASGVLVALGKKFCNEVMEELLKKFQLGTLPHFFVVQTLANLSTTNPFGFIPFLTLTLGTMLPMLGMAKHDNIKWVFSAALARFSESILDYVANLENAPDPTVTKEAFSNLMYSAFDVCFTVWLQSKEAKLRLIVVEALGNMAHILSRDKLEELLPKVIPGILALYKKHSEPYYITQGLCMILEAAVLDESIIMEPQLDTVLHMLHQQVCVPPDYRNPMTVKNHNELLRCFGALNKSFSERVVAFLLEKMNSNNEKTRVGTLTVFKQLINSAGPPMENKKGLILSGLKNVLADPNNKVKKMFAQVVIAMADHDYLSEEGGQLMVEFIVKQCALSKNEVQSKKQADTDWVSNEALRSMCGNVLNLITTTIANMESVLWPSLLEYLAQEPYTESISVLCSNLAHIAGKKREEESSDYFIDFDAHVNIPKPDAIIARLMVMAGRPKRGHKRGIPVLKLMQALSPNLQENIVGMWDTVIPKLIQYLEDNADDDEKWSQKAWEDLLLKLLSKTLDEIEDEEWICAVGTSMGHQLTMYEDMPEEKNLLYKCLGVVMKKVGNKQFIQKQLDVMFATVKYSSQVEREGCAIGVGFCAGAHLDAAVSKLEKVAKEDMSRKSSGLFGLVKDKSEADVEKIKSTVVLCYGYLTLYSPPELIVSRLEANILQNITPYLAKVKDLAVKQNLIRAVDLIGKSMHPDHLLRPYRFGKKKELINYLLMYMKAESVKELFTQTRALSMQACATLVKLDPALTEADTFDLIKTSTDCIFKLPDCLYPGKTKDDNTAKRVQEIDDIISVTFASHQVLLQEILRKDVSSDCLHSIFKHLEPYLVSMSDAERERALTSTKGILEFYLEKLTDVSGGPSAFGILGTLLGRLVPRCSDPNLGVRSDSLLCVQLVLKIQLRYEGHPANYPDKIVQAFDILMERAAKGDPQLLFSLINDLSKALSRKIPADQLKPFIFLLIESLLDIQSHCSSGACVVLNTLLKTRGAELLTDVEDMIAALHFKMNSIEVLQTRTGTLRAVRTFATNHLEAVVSTLLKYPLPYDSHIVECWKSLATDPTILLHIFNKFLDTLSRNVHYEEKIDLKTKKTLSKTATLIPLATVCALTEMLKVEEVEGHLHEHFPRLFACLLVYAGSSVGIKPPKEQASLEKQDTLSSKEKKAAAKAIHHIKPCSVAIDGLKALISHGQGAKLLTVLEEEGLWEMLQKEDKFHEGVILLSKGMATHLPGYIPSIVNCLSPTLSSLHEPQRVVVVAFFAELVNQQCVGDVGIVEGIINNLLGRLIDSCHTVRMLCIRGLGNIASLGPEQVQKYCTTVLSAMMAGMDDKEDPDDDITLEAMSGLSKVLKKIDEANIRPILVNIALRIRPCFEKDRATVRAAAFDLFGTLSRFSNGPSKAPFLEQIHTNLVSFLLHLNDEDENVKKSCKFALRQFGPLLGSASLNEMFQNHLIEDGHLSYGEFMFDLSKVIIADFLQKVNFYVMGNVSFFRSSWPDIRGNAAMFTGFLLGNLPKDNRGLITKEHVCGAMTMLLKDQSPEVRIKAAEAMSLLFEF